MDNELYHYGVKGMKWDESKLKKISSTLLRNEEIRNYKIKQQRSKNAEYDEDEKETDDASELTAEEKKAKELEAIDGRKRKPRDKSKVYEHKQRNESGEKGLLSKYSSKEAFKMMIEQRNQAAKEATEQQRAKEAEERRKKKEQKSYISTNMSNYMKHGYYQNELYHYGVLGMKWGRRKAKSSSGERSRRSKKSDDYLRAKKLKRKRLSQLSNSELKDLNNRMQLENQYKNLKRQQNVGKKFVQDVLYETAKNTASEYAKKYTKQGIKAISDISRRV